MLSKIPPAWSKAPVLSRGCSINSLISPISRQPGYLSRRAFKSSSVQFNSQPQPQPQQPPPQKPESPSTSSFKPFQRPFLKVFLGAILTYQVLYWAWTKLEMDELKLEKKAPEELSALEQKARKLSSTSS